MAPEMRQECVGMAPETSGKMPQIQNEATAYPERLGMSQEWWQKHQAGQVLELIQRGVSADKLLPPQLSLFVQKKSPLEIESALEILREYESIGAVSRLKTTQSVKHFIPWFVLTKPSPESVTEKKVRLIVDARELNQFFAPPKFRMEHWGHIFPYLKKGCWAAKIDLRHAFFHLPLSDALRPHVCLQVGDSTWQFQGAAFGIASIPYLWTKVMLVHAKFWRKQGITCFLYLNDILLVGCSPQQVKNHLQIMLKFLSASGLVINSEKSLLTPSQCVTHLGFTIDFALGIVSVPKEKMKISAKETGKTDTNQSLTPRTMAAFLGAVRSLLTAMPFLRAFTDAKLHFAQEWQKSGQGCLRNITPLFRTR